MKTGLDRLVRTSAIASRLRGARFGLLAHPASVTKELIHVSDALAELGVKPEVIFGPEHGYGGEAQDMIGVDDARDARGTPVRSLYGARFDDLSPKEADLRGLDLVVVDLQDVGSRYYTFVWTAVLLLRACVRAGVRLLVLDRPNPIGGDARTLEGRSQTIRSFVGLEPIPVRHGLTLGEIVAWRAAVEKVPAGLVQVVRVEGLVRFAHARDWDRAFVMPSPNMPTYETALVYPGACLLEGTNLSEGRGTTRPFEIFGAPWLDGVALARDVMALGMPGFIARPITFHPMFQKHAKQICGGVQIHVTDARTFRPFAAYLAVIAIAKRLGGEAFRFRTEKYEFVDDVPAFDLLTGDAEARERIMANDDPRAIAGDIGRLRIGDETIVNSAIIAADRMSV